MAEKSNNKKSSRSPKKPKTTKQTEELEAKQPVEPKNRPQSVTVVGIGASAGGLVALQRFFTELPADTGMSFVVVTHLHPEHESHLAELLQKHTTMPTVQVTSKTKVEPNHVYVIPPNRSIEMTDTHLDTVSFEQPHGQRTPIDHFFRSLAEGQREAVAVILSGGGTDGSVGVKDIKEVGGLIFVQHPDDAEYDSMPRAALSTGLADVVLPANQLAVKLAEYSRHRPQLPHDAGQLSEQELEILQRILAQVHARTGHDFNQYKRSTILRRVERRMQLNGFITLEAYLNHLRHNAAEAQSMFNDILIGVTNFFRDHDAWLALDEVAIPALFEHKDEHNEIRVWSIGCATGEEAYGLAIMLFEYAAKIDFRPHIQIFASDLDERSIAHAREGIYPAAIEADVSAERLERFFTREGEYYRIKRELRDAVLFTNHNVLRDPPFSRQDLIACRNVLIYLQRSVQDRVFDIFHYALNPAGFLFLGSSESAEHLPEMFQVLDKNHRIYRAKPWAGERPQIPSMPLSIRRSSRTNEPYANVRPSFSRFVDETLVAEEHHQRALESYGPPSVLVNERYMILHVSETAGRYLHQPKGPITGDLLKLVRTELQLELRTVLFQAFEKEQAVVSRPIPVQFNGHPRPVTIAVRPRFSRNDVERIIEKQALVIFMEDESEESLAPAESQRPRSQTERDQLVAQLESEVQRLREQLQITIEEHESSNEEMKAANEELQSINEEYRSATEELETSKEELQSVNEELQTVNSEMRNKLEEVSRAHAELENLMGATDIPTLYLDRELHIQRYTAGIRELFNIMPVDRGRPISHLTNKLTGYDQFLEDAEQVLRQLVPLEREVQIGDGGTYLLRLRPFRTMEDRIEGVVATFVDINQLKESERQLVLTKELLEQRVAERTGELNEANQQVRQARDMFYTLFHSNPIPTSLTRLENGEFLNVNDAYLEFAGRERDELIGRTAQELYLPIPIAMRPQVIEQLRQEGLIRNLEMQVNRGSGELATVLASIQLIRLDESEALLLSFIDISERVRAEQEIRTLASDLTIAEQEERRRISQILHDDLQQRIFAVKMQTSVLQDAYQKGHLQSAQVDFDQLEELLNESITITRNLSIDLSPAVLQGEGLADALVWLAAQMQDQYGLQVTIAANSVVTRFEGTLRILLFQAVRESLFNVVKHADTDHAQISLSHDTDAIRVTISDDGQGFDADGAFDESQAAGGLMNIRHRLQLMGCELHVQSTHGQGTQVVIYVPDAQVKP